MAFREQVAALDESRSRESPPGHPVPLTHARAWPHPLLEGFVRDTRLQASTRAISCRAEISGPQRGTGARGDQGSRAGGGYRQASRRSVAGVGERECGDGIVRQDPCRLPVARPWSTTCEKRWNAKGMPERIAQIASGCDLCCKWLLISGVHPRPLTAMVRRPGTRMMPIRHRKRAMWRTGNMLASATRQRRTRGTGAMRWSDGTSDGGARRRYRSRGSTRHPRRAASHSGSKTASELSTPASAKPSRLSSG